MSGNSETIKSFLISLGFDIDGKSASKFEAVLKGVTANVLKVGATMEGAALSIVGFTTQIASGLDKIYWASQRTGATVTGIKALGYAASQTGASAEMATSSLESLARFMRHNPGAEGFLNRLGIQTRDASGRMRDTAAIFTGVGQKLSRMPYYRANQYAQMLGIDENTLMAMRRGLNGFTADYQSMLQKTGFNADKAAAQSNKFMTSMKGLTALFGIMRDKIGSSLAGGLAGSLDTLRRQILDNFPKIEATLTTLLKGVLWFADAFSRMVYRLVQGAGAIIDWWKKLDNGSKNLLKIVGALFVAWKLLNSAFLKSPIGLITTLILALGLLWDDYQTWKEGGESLIDWAKWEPGIKKAIDAIKSIASKISQVVDALGGWETVLKGLALYLGGKWLLAMLTPIGKVTKALLAFPAAFMTALKAAGLYAVIASIDEAYKRIKAMKEGKTYDQIASQSEEMKERDKLARENWARNNPGQPFPENAFTPAFNAPSPTKKGAELLGWLAPTFGKLEQLYRLPAGLLRSVAITESGGNQFAMSGAGAKGLFQFMDGTARDMGLRGNDVFNPEKSAQAAAKYLSQLLRANGGDLNKTLASYNWGIGNVKRYGMGLMPQETRNYIPRVMSNMPAAGAQVQQQNTYNIYGGGDARAVGSEVERRQQSANAQFMRGNQTKVG